MNAIRNKTIAIVGAGPGRCMLARLLQMSGAEIKVYERDLNRNARAQGATPDLHEESGLKALREAGLMEEFEANYHLNEDFSDVQSATAAYEKQMLVRAAEVAKQSLEQTAALHFPPCNFQYDRDNQRIEHNEASD